MVAFKLTLVCLTLMAAQAAAQVRGCYYQNDARYRPAPGKFDQSSQYNSGLCSHAFFAFAQVTDLGLSGPSGGYPIVKNFKANNPSLKVLLSIGGDGKAYTFEGLVANSANINTWAKNAIAYTKNNGFDGIDIDWEFPVGYKSQFTALMKALKANAPSGFLITAALTADVESKAQNSYDIAAIRDTVNFFNVMTYDYHGVWNGVTGHNAGMGTSTSEKWSIQWTVQYYLNAGIPANKIILGIPTYARGFTLNNGNANQGPNSPATQPAMPGPVLHDVNGIYVQYELCKIGGTRGYDSAQKATYKQNGNQWFSYEDTTSINEKVKYIKSKGLGGAFIWSLDDDDFGNTCGGGKYPIMNAINKALIGQTFFG